MKNNVGLYHQNTDIITLRCRYYYTKLLLIPSSTSSICVKAAEKISIKMEGIALISNKTYLGDLTSHFASFKLPVKMTSFAKLQKCLF